MLYWLLNSYNERTTWQYDGLGRVTTMTYANGAVAENDYDAASRLTALRNLKSDRSVISIFTYTYDSTGNRLGVAEANGDLVSWSYDNTYQLTREQRTGANSYDITYTYDGVGNRLTKLEGGVTTSSSYDGANQLLTAEDNTGVTTFSYDANGNTTLELKPNSDRTTYTWDVENHVTKVELPVSIVNTITLDGDGKRRTIEDFTGLKKLIWDAENILAETNSGGATTATYTLAPEQYGNLISQRRSTTTSWHLYDALGSTDRLSDSSQTELASYLQTAFGVPKATTGNHPNRYNWIGQKGYRSEPDIGQYDVRRRRHDPGRGVWMSADPHRSGKRSYIYTNNRPITHIDPKGLFPILGYFDLQAACQALPYAVDKAYEVCGALPGHGTGTHKECCLALTNLFISLADFSWRLPYGSAALKRYINGLAGEVWLPYDWVTAPISGEISGWKAKVRRIVGCNKCDAPLKRFHNQFFACPSTLRWPDQQWTLFTYTVDGFARAGGECSYPPPDWGMSWRKGRYLHFELSMLDTYNFDMRKDVTIPCHYVTGHIEDDIIIGDELGKRLTYCGAAEFDFKMRQRETECVPCGECPIKYPPCSGLT